MAKNCILLKNSFFKILCGFWQLQDIIYYYIIVGTGFHKNFVIHTVLMRFLHIFLYMPKGYSKSEIKKNIMLNSRRESDHIAIITFMHSGLLEELLFEN